MKELSEMLFTPALLAKRAIDGLVKLSIHPERESFKWLTHHAFNHLKGRIASTNRTMDEQTTSVTMKKKKTPRFYETYISKVLKQISSRSGITANACQQLNSALCIITRSVSDLTATLTEIAGKKTLFDKEVTNALSLVLPANLGKDAIAAGEEAIKCFKSTNGKGYSRQEKAGILFPPSITEKFLRSFGYTKIMVNNTAPVCLAGAMEYIASQLLQLACTSARDNKRIRVTIRDLELAVRGDADMDSIFRRMNISFLGGGTTPFIHESLLTRKTRKRRVKADGSPGTKKPHRFRPGTVSVREIKKFQKMSDCLTFAKFPFEKAVRATIAQQTMNDIPMKISKDVFIILQYFIEQYVVDLLRDANFAAIHAGRVKLMPIDIQFVSSVAEGGPNPYSVQGDLVCDEDEVEAIHENKLQGIVDAC